MGRARIGECSTKDLEEIEKLVLTNPECDVPDFTKPPWDQAILVTPRHSVRNLWNEHAIAKHCAKTRNQRFQVAAEDICQDGNDDLSMETKLAIAEQNDKHTGKLSVSVQMAIGMKAMVLLNVATEADIANGTLQKLNEETKKDWQTRR